VEIASYDTPNHSFSEENDPEVSNFVSGERRARSQAGRSALRRVGSGGGDRSTALAEAFPPATAWRADGEMYAFVRYLSVIKATICCRAKSI